MCFNPKRMPGDRNTPEAIACGEVKVTLRKNGLCIDVEVYKDLKKSFEFKEDEVLDEFLKFMYKDVDEAMKQ